MDEECTCCTEGKSKNRMPQHKHYYRTYVIDTTVNVLNGRGEALSFTYFFFKYDCNIYQLRKGKARANLAHYFFPKKTLDLSHY